MNVTIVGNPKNSSEKMKKIETRLTDASVNVRHPAMEGLDTADGYDIIETFERIDWCDWVIAVPLEGLTFGQQTTSELAYAKHAKKPVFIYYDA